MFNIHLMHYQKKIVNETMNRFCGLFTEVSGFTSWEHFCKLFVERVSHPTPPVHSLVLTFTRAPSECHNNPTDTGPETTPS